MANLFNLADGRFVRFAAVGLLTTIMDVVLFALFAAALEIPVTPANVMSYSCGIATSFLLNRWWTFASVQQGGTVEVQALRFLASNITGLVLSTILVGLFVQVFPAMIAKTMSVPIVFIWNYLVARYWVFR